MKQFLYWKKMPSRSFIAVENHCLTSKVQRAKWLSCLGAGAYGNFNLKPMLIYHSENPRTLKSYAKSITLASINGTTKPGWQYTCLQNGLLNILSPLLKLAIKKKKKSFLSKYYYSFVMFLVTKELWWRCTRLILFSFLLTQHPSCSPWTYFDFMFCYWRNIFCKAVATIVVPLMDLGKVNIKPSGKVSPF